tara:strand:+ start:393 stop:617 length:225 start_codon:yes stop_codon:yes gene_type:complete
MTEVEIKLDQTQLEELKSAADFNQDEIASAIRSISEVDGGSGNAFIGIAQGLWSIAEAIEKHTQYLKDRDRNHC